MALVGVLFLVGCGGGGYRFHSKDVLLQIEKNPEKYKGGLYAFQGEVIQAGESKGITMFQLLVSEGTYDFNGVSLMVAFNGNAATIVKEHDVRVLGYIGEIMVGQNAFGGTIAMPTMVAAAAWDLTSGQVYWNNEYKNVYDKWASGELFSTK